MNFAIAFVIFKYISFVDESDKLKQEIKEANSENNHKNQQVIFA